VRQRPGQWWIFQPRGHGRRHLTPIGLTWTLAAYGLLGLGTVEVVRRLAGLEGIPNAGLILMVLGLSAGWTAVRVCMDGEFARASIWFTGIGWLAVSHLMTEAPACGNLVFGAGLPGISPGIAPCTPHQDFMATVFIAAWVVAGPLAAGLLSALSLYRWDRRDPLHAYRFLVD
jgi:hypothetical protein